MIFAHSTNWGIGGDKSWSPTDGNGNIIPHIFGHLCDPTCGFGDMYLPNWEDFDLYKVIETIEDAFNPWSFQLQNVYIPIGFEKCDPFISVKEYHSTYCDSGCYDCGHEYEHVDFGGEPESGVFLVPKGSIVVELTEFQRGNGYFPNIFKLKERNHE